MPRSHERMQLVEISDELFMHPVFGDCFNHTLPSFAACDAAAVLMHYWRSKHLQHHDYEAFIDNVINYLEKFKEKVLEDPSQVYVSVEEDVPDIDFEAQVGSLNSDEAAA